MAVAGGGPCVTKRPVRNFEQPQIISEQERYGFTEEEYKAYVEAGQESARLCADVHQYLSHSPNVPSYIC